MANAKKVAVIGEGVVGLCTALALLERGIRVTLYAASVNRAQMRTVDASDKALAIWYPSLVAGTKEVGDWAVRSYCKLAMLAQHPTETGVRTISDYELVCSEEEFLSPPAYLTRLDSFQAVERFRVRVPDDVVGVWTFDTFAVEMPRYLEYLRALVAAFGGDFVPSLFSDMASAVDCIDETTIINCAGLGARALVSDPSVRPVKGHLLYYKPVDLNFTVARVDVTIMPRSDFLVVGALFIDTFNSLTPTEGDRDRMIAEVESWQSIDLLGFGLQALDFGADAIVKEVTGLRPYRNGGVRLEHEEMFGRQIVHNYGHGGSGVTLAWGCAEAVTALVVGGSRLDR